MRRRDGVCAVVVLLALASGAQADEELPNAVPSVLYKRWALSMAYGADFVRARTEGAEVHPTFFGELALRYRVLRELEVGASIGGGLTRELGYAAIYADLRYRLRAEMPWTPYVLGSVGGAKIDPSNGWHLLVRGGVGLERRFVSWAFAADVQLAHVGAHRDAGPYSPSNVAGEMEIYGIWATTVSLAAIYYWGSGGPSLRRHGVP